MLVILLGSVATLACIGWRLHRTNMHVGDNVERRISQREALRFALDNDLPLR